MSTRSDYLARYVRAGAATATDAQAARDLGVSAARICQIRRMLGVPTYHPRPSRDGAICEPGKAAATYLDEFVWDGVAMCTDAEAGSMLGVSTGRIWRIRVDAGIAPFHASPRRRQDGETAALYLERYVRDGAATCTDAEAARALGVGPTWVHQIRRRRGIRSHREEVRSHAAAQTSAAACIDMQLYLEDYVVSGRATATDALVAADLGVSALDVRRLRRRLAVLRFAPRRPSSAEQRAVEIAQRAERRDAARARRASEAKERAEAKAHRAAEAIERARSRLAPWTMNDRLTASFISIAATLGVSRQRVSYLAERAGIEACK